MTIIGLHSLYATAIHVMVINLSEASEKVNNEPFSSHAELANYYPPPQSELNFPPQPATGEEDEKEIFWKQLRGWTRRGRRRSGTRERVKYQHGHHHVIHEWNNKRTSVKRTCYGLRRGGSRLKYTNHWQLLLHLHLPLSNLLFLHLWRNDWGRSVGGWSAPLFFSSASQSSRVSWPGNQVYEIPEQQHRFSSILVRSQPSHALHTSCLFLSPKTIEANHKYASRSLARSFDGWLCINWQRGISKTGNQSISLTDLPPSTNNQYNNNRGEDHRSTVDELSRSRSTASDRWCSLIGYRGIKFKGRSSIGFLIFLRFFSLFNWHGQLFHPQRSTPKRCSHWCFPTNWQVCLGPCN